METRRVSEVRFAYTPGFFSSAYPVDHLDHWITFSNVFP
jgi:hypothetical protein